MFRMLTHLRSRLVVRSSSPPLVALKLAQHSNFLVSQALERSKSDVLVSIGENAKHDCGKRC